MKNLKKTISVLILLLLTGCCCGCVIIKSDDDQLQKSEVMPELSESIAVGDAMLEAIKGNDYRQFTSVIPISLKSEVTEEQFKVAREQFSTEFGEITGYSYLTSLESPTVNNLVWKVTFEEEGSDSINIRRELLFRVVTAVLDGKIEVMSFGFF